jgi:hypothetical protein
MPLPLLIDIADVKLNDELLVDCVISIGNDSVVYDRTSSEFHKARTIEAIEKKLAKIWQAIDLKIAHSEHSEENILKILDIHTLEDFTDLCLYTDLCTTNEIYSILEEISFYHEKLKKNFMDACIEMFELKREFPKIKLEDDKISQYISRYSEYYQYPESMYALQFAAEYPMTIWFNENIGKAFNEWSWREIECKRLYMAMKNNTEGFRELVKAKAMEVSREGGR